MFISTIIPTIGRPTLSRAVYSVLGQEFEHEDYEVIVVNDTGQELPFDDWQKYANVRMITTNQRNRSIARNTGAAIANGRYFHFLDDDDWILPGAFESFWEVARHVSAAWYHGGFRLVDNSGEKIVDVFQDEANNCFVQLVSWEWLPLQASFVDAKAFFSVGGFAMLESLRGGFEDIHLTRQIAHKYDFMNIPNLIACIRAGDIESTTNYTDMFLQNHQSREITLDMPRAFSRLLASAQNNRFRKEYWFGKIVYYYLGSANRNIKEKRLFKALSRMSYALTGFSIACRYFLKTDFWYGMFKPHISCVWSAIKNTQIELFPNTLWK